MFNKPESEDRTGAQQALRVFLKERPAEFCRQLAAMETQHTARKLKSQDRMSRQPEEPSGPVLPEDDGTDRVKGLLERALEEFDAQPR